MLVTLGARRDSLDVIDLLLDCHTKIRRFIGIAQRMAGATSSNLDDIRTAAGGIARYFAVAFPLHVADENELLLPRLVGRFAHTDRALSYMREDHADHAALVDSLTKLCVGVRDEPQRLAELAPELRTVLAELAPLVEQHLAMEEADIFPVLRFLAADEKQAIVAAMRQRRTVR